MLCRVFAIVNVFNLIVQWQAQEACIAMQSCKRIAKLCVSDAAMYEDYFGLTQQAVLRALTTTPAVKTLMAGLSATAVLEKLTIDLFSE